jgi:hypothetical protein
MENPKVEIKTFKEQVKDLRVKHPNDKEFGMAVATLLHNTKDLIPCCLCDEDIQEHPLTKWKYGHNPDPLGKNDEDRCCDTCNETKVLPKRIDFVLNRKNK